MRGEGLGRVSEGGALAGVHVFVVMPRVHILIIQGPTMYVNMGLSGFGPGPGSLPLEKHVLEPLSLKAIEYMWNTSNKHTQPKHYMCKGDAIFDNGQHFSIPLCSPTCLLICSGLQ